MNKKQQAPTVYWIALVMKYLYRRLSCSVVLQGGGKACRPVGSFSSLVYIYLQTRIRQIFIIIYHISSPLPLYSLTLQSLIEISNGHGHRGEWPDPKTSHPSQTGVPKLSHACWLPARPSFHILTSCRHTLLT